MEFKRIAIIYRWIFWIPVLVGLIAWIILLVNYWSSSLPWTGFFEYTIKRTEEQNQIDKKKTVKVTKEIQASKTLWDWLQLAGTLGTATIPVVLTYGGYLLNQREQERDDKRKEADRKRDEEREETDRNRTAENLREEALQNYFDRISELLLKHKLGQPVQHPIPAQNNNLARDIARVLTLTVLSRLDGDGQRKATIVRFLHEAELIKGREPIINLDRADLSGAILTKAILSSTNLGKANLRGADLTFANLSHADLREADLRDTILSHANLEGADLAFANLSRADLREADLREAILTQAILTKVFLLDADLDRANLNGAILTSANLTSAQFFMANLTSADLSSAKNLFDLQLVKARLCNTTLPDGTVSNRDCGK
jgi:uncharacterized protein YjbI with pentapeptide repeats/uncharacterized membrane protein YkoI